jgi:tyrosyl-tRNA synthetase
MQAYDSVQIHSDVELGGTDQIFNILLGRELQREVGQEPQVAVTNPLLEGLDGHQKMSKSKGNYIGISEAPADIFGKAMSIPDELMQKYFVLATDVPLDKVEMYLSGDVHPREAKAELAGAIVRRYHDEEAAREARKEFNRVFKQGELPDDMPTVTIPNSEKKDGQVWIVKLVRLAGCAESNSEARRVIAQGGVSLGRDADSLEPVKSANTDLEVADGTILKVGKLHYCRLENE